MRVSIIVEWENVLLAEASRASDLLRALGQQVRALPPAQLPVEVLVLHGDDRVDEAALRRAVDEALAPGAAVAVRVVHAPGRSYYELKNHGADLAGGDLLVFLDCDVRLHDGWLEHLLAPFADDRVHVVGGHCYLEPDGLVGKAFATFWLFPFRHAGETSLRRATRFYANNVAFRRDTFARHRFLPIDGATRGACRWLAERLAAQGVPIHRTTAAQVGHPAPAGLRHLATRALAHGRDDVFRARATGDRRGAGVGRALNDIPLRMRDVVRGRGRVGLSWPGTLAAGLVAASYYALRTAGNVFARVFPGAARRRWRI